MASSNTKAEAMKPFLLKAGIPLAISLVGFIIARITKRKSSVSKPSPSKPQSNFLEANTPEYENDESFRSIDSIYLPYMEAENVLTESQNKERYELEKVLGLRSRIEDLEDRERNLEMRFVHYQGLKEQELLLMEIHNKLVLEITGIEFLSKEVSSIEAENRRYEEMAIEYLKVLEELQIFRIENGLLDKRVRKLSIKLKQRSRVVREQKLKIEAREEVELRNNGELERRAGSIKALEDENGKLQTLVEKLQEEKYEMMGRLDLAEQSSSLKIEEERITVENYQLLYQLEQLENDRSAEAKELIHLRWCCACLRHELARRNQEQQEQMEEKNKKKNKLELNCNGRGEIGDFGLDHELDGHILGHGHNYVHGKRSKIIEKFKRWVEGGEKIKHRLDEKEKNEFKCFGRHFDSDCAEEGQLPARKSCSSA